VGDPIIGFTGRTGLFPENMSHAINCKPDEATLYLTIKNEHGVTCASLSYTSTNGNT